MNDTITDKIKEVVTKRASNLAWKIIKSFDVEHKDRRFYMAGGCLGGTVNDIDLFPIDPSSFLKPGDFDCEGEIANTKNAITIKPKDIVIQLCNYQKQSLKELIESFDFANTRCGVSVTIEDGIFKIDEVYITEDCILSWATNKTWFISSDYPLSSLMRCQKYYSRGMMTHHEYIVEILKITALIIKRGFSGYEDLKNQLDAIDMGYILTGEEQSKIVPILLTLNGINEAELK